MAGSERTPREPRYRAGQPAAREASPDDPELLDLFERVPDDVWNRSSVLFSGS